MPARGAVVEWHGAQLGFEQSRPVGNGTKTNSATPTAIPNLSGVAAIAGGSTAGYALLTDGSVKAWGNNDEGMVGDGTSTMRLTPTTVSGLSGVVQISTAQKAAYALLSDGTVKAWGQNTYGQLGDGTTTTRLSPVTVQVPAGQRSPPSPSPRPRVRDVRSSLRESRCCRSTSSRRRFPPARRVRSGRRLRWDRRASRTLQCSSLRRLVRLWVHRRARLMPMVFSRRRSRWPICGPSQEPSAVSRRRVVRALDPTPSRFSAPMPWVSVTTPGTRWATGAHRVETIGEQGPCAPRRRSSSGSSPHR